jgi:hypothetical protein
MGFFVGLKIRVNITNISPEQTYDGLKFVYVNFSLQYDPGVGQWTPITPSEMEYFWPGPLPMAIIDPTTISDPIECLAEQAKASMLMFIGQTYDTSQISFADMTLDLSPFDSLTIKMDWSSKGVLKNVEVNYGTTNLASIKEGSLTPPPGIPGYDLLIVIGVGIVSLLGMLYIANKRKEEK